MPGLRDISNRALRELVGTRCLITPLVEVEDGVHTFEVVSGITGGLQVMIDGAIYQVADANDITVATLAALQTPVTGQAGYYACPKSQNFWMLLVVNAAGTFYMIQGNYGGRTYNDSTGKNVTTPPIAEIPEVAVFGTYAPVAAIYITNGVTATFTPGTDNWDATNVNAQVLNIGVVPATLAASLTPVDTE